MDDVGMLRIRDKLRCIWKDVMADEKSIDVWKDSFKAYDFETVDTAVIQYIAKSKYKPTPADIIEQIPAKYAMYNRDTGAVKPKYETLPDGKLVRVYECRRCCDTGLITWDNAEGCTMAKPCVCQAARHNYPSAFNAYYNNGGNR